MLWDFGDGVTSTETNPVHTYTSGGNYNPTLTISGPDGESQHQDVIQVIGDEYLIYLPLIRYIEVMYQTYYPIIRR
jgi:hypothetical protein